MSSNTVYVSNVDVGSNLKWLSASATTLRHHFDSTLTQNHKMGNGYSVLLAVWSVICPASFGHVLPFCMGQKILANE
jgi:hypothetical protein